MLGLYMSYLNQYIHPISAVQVGFIYTGYRLVEFLGDPVMGALSDRYGRKPFMLLGPLFSALAVQVYPSATTFIAILLLLTIEGLNAAMRPSVSLSYLSDVTTGSEKLRGRTMSIYQLALLLSIVGGYLIGGSLWDRLGATGFRLISILYLLGMSVIWIGVKEAPQRADAHRYTLKEYFQLARNPAILGFLPTWLAMAAILGAWLSQIAYQMSARSDESGQALVGGFSGVQIGLVLAAFALIYAAGTLGWGFLMGKRSKIRLVLISLSGILLCGLGLLVINHPPAEANGLASMLLITAYILLGVGILLQSGFSPLAFAYLADLSEGFPGERGAILGGYYLFLSIGQLLGAWLGGLFAQAHQLDGVIYLSLGLAVLGILNLRRAGAPGNN